MNDGLEKDKGGAPSKLTNDSKLKVLAGIQRGATYELASAYAGISYSTFRNWMRKGEEQDEQENGDEFLDFYRAVKNAEGVAAMLWLDKIDKAADGGYWQAAAWKLERRYPQQYGKTVQEIQGKDGAPIEYANLSTEERLARVNTILEQARARRAIETHSDDRERPVSLEADPRTPDASLF